MSIRGDRTTLPMGLVLLAGLILLSRSPCRAQAGSSSSSGASLLPFTPAAAAPKPQRPQYGYLPYDEDWSFLRDPKQRTDSFDPLKFIPLNKNGTRYLTLGGELRVSYQRFSASSLAQTPTNGGSAADRSSQGRFTLSADWHLGEQARIFGQLRNASEAGRHGPVGPIDRNRLDFQQIFVDAGTKPTAPVTLAARAGRQELFYGSGRLIEAREGPNVRLAFDGVRAAIHAAGWQVDGFITHPVQPRPGAFDDTAEKGLTFQGIYAVGPLAQGPKGNAHIDLYFLDYLRQNAVFDQGAGEERRYSVGTRLWGRREALDYNWEGVVQWGRFGQGAIAAWTLGTETGYTWDHVQMQPRLSLRVDFASGNRRKVGEGLGTFNALFPRGDYFDDGALVGPANVRNGNLFLELHPSPRLTLTPSGGAYWRDSLSDGIYDGSSAFVLSGKERNARFIGSQAQMAIVWQADRHLTFRGIYERFFAGPFLEEAGQGSDIRRFNITADFQVLNEAHNRSKTLHTPAPWSLCAIITP